MKMIKILLTTILTFSFLAATTNQSRDNKPVSNKKENIKSNSSEKNIFEITIVPCKKENSNFLDKPEKQTKADCSTTETIQTNK